MRLQTGLLLWRGSSSGSDFKPIANGTTPECRLSRGPPGGPSRDADHGQHVQPLQDVDQRECPKMLFDRLAIADPRGCDIPCLLTRMTYGGPTGLEIRRHPPQNHCPSDYHKQEETAQPSVGVAVRVADRKGRAVC